MLKKENLSFKTTDQFYIAKLQFSIIIKYRVASMKSSFLIYRMFIMVQEGFINLVNKIQWDHVTTTDDPAVVFVPFRWFANKLASMQTIHPSVIKHEVHGVD